VPAARASAPGDGPPVVDKAPHVAKRVAPTHAWEDGGARRGLWLDASVRADFSPALAGRGTVLRQSAGPLKDVPDALQSPVLRDESGRARALPGGVLVVFAEPADDAAVRALIASHGANVARRVNETTWLVASPPGLASLELANRLAATGAFASAQPNWWTERVRK
jgi:hypothetical protein